LFENGKMQFQELIERDDKLDKILIVLDKKSSTDNFNILADVSSTTKLLKVVPLAKASDIFKNLEKNGEIG